MVDLGDFRALPQGARAAASRNTDISQVRVIVRRQTIPSFIRVLTGLPDAAASSRVAGRWPFQLDVTTIGATLQWIGA